jgi:flagellar assembly protein FliH
MNSAVKFTFDTHFDSGSEEPRAESRSRKSYSADEIEAMRSQAHQEGQSAGDIRATEAMSVSIAQVAAAVLAAIEAMDEEIEAIRAEAASLALAAAKRLASAALAASPEAEVAEALQVALRHAVGEPRVVVKTAPALARAIEQRAAEIAVQEGYEGRMQFVADNALIGADCRIEWKDGGLERSERAIETALEDLIARRFPARPERND